jgi:acetyl esterase/lipase
MLAFTPARGTLPMRPHPLLFVALLTPSFACADGPADNVVEQVRQVPKPGIEIPDNDRRELDAGLARFKSKLEEIEHRLTQKGVFNRALVPDIRVYYKAVHDALAYNEIFAKEEIARAKSVLEMGLLMAESFLNGDANWPQKKRTVVLAYTSKIDGSDQPYGLVIPSSYSPTGEKKFRLDLWFHGRGETLSELNFIDQRSKQIGEFAPADTIVLHPYGRFCNANKLAGEVDALEAIEAVRKRFQIDDDRISVRGFSMGGAAAWHFAVHYSDRWFAANPGAGFSETPRFLNVFQRETLAPTWYEKKLWHLYDCNEVAANLLQCPTVAYSGEIDNQKQAADVMAEALKAEGVELMHVIGPKTPHRYHPDAKREVEARLDSLAERGRERFPRSVALATYTLKYNRMNWVTIDALAEHWEKADVRARISGRSALDLRTQNVTAITLDFPAGYSPFDETTPVNLVIDGDRLDAPRTASDRSWRVRIHHESDGWKLGAAPENSLQKRHDLQGPIDDAFMDAFLFVRPTGESSNKAVAAWVKSEQDRAVVRWRRQFRGEARVKDDKDLTDADIATANLVLWGDPQSNSVLKRIADKLPIGWNADRIAAGDRSFPSGNHALIAVYPNPLNPRRYVVLNSGFTFREYDDLNNARQVPKLPDWAIVDVRTKPNSRFPGKVVAADFFGEKWELLANTR